jgi:hypothetical protein
MEGDIALGGGLFTVVSVSLLDLTVLLLVELVTIGSASADTGILIAPINIIKIVAKAIL